MNRNPLTPRTSQQTIMAETTKLTRVRLLACAGLIAFAPACSSGSSSNKKKKEAHNATFVAPSGSGFAGGQLKKLPFQATLTRDYTLAVGEAAIGTVTDAALNGLVGVEIEFAKSPTSPAIDSTTTDGIGAYAVSLTPGTWVARLDDGGALGRHTVTGLVVAPGGSTIDIAYPATVATTGTIFEDGGPAIPLATLDFTGQNSGAVVSVVADGLGDYAADLIPDTYDVVVAPAGVPATTHLKQRMPDVVVSVAGAQDFFLLAGASVSGVVRDDLGDALLDDADISVSLPTGSNFFPPMEVTANAVDGTYTIEPVPLGAVTFVVDPTGDTGFPVQELARTIATSGAVIEDLALAIGVVVDGTILEDDGLTGANATVSMVSTTGAALPQETDTDPGGFYRISVFLGEYEQIRTPNDDLDLQLPESELVTIAAATTIDATLVPGVVLQGAVLEPDGVTPAESIRVEIEGLATSSDVTDGLGEYSFLAPVGTHVLLLTGTTERYLYTAIDPVTGVVVTDPGPITEDFTMALTTTGSNVMSGTVFEDDGATVIGGVQITSRASNGEILARTYSAADGTYAMPVK